MFEQFVTEILKVRGMGSIAIEFGMQFLRKVRKLGRIHPNELNSTKGGFVYCYIKDISTALDLPTSFVARLLQYNKFDDIWR